MTIRCSVRALLTTPLLVTALLVTSFAAHQAPTVAETTAPISHAILTAKAVPAVALRQGPRRLSPHACVTPTAGMVITTSTCFSPGTYPLSVGITIAGNNLTLDGGGATIRSTQINTPSAGILISGQANVTITNITISGYNIGLRIVQSHGIDVENVNASGNGPALPNRKSSLLINNDSDITTTNNCGEGIRLEHAWQSTIISNTTYNEGTGIELIGSNYNQILDNMTSRYAVPLTSTTSDSCWGIRLSSSSGNLLRGNVADGVINQNGAINSLCVTYMQGCYAADAAGLLLVNGSDRNQILNNSLRYNGDGFFIGNQFDASSDYNYVYGNDASYALSGNAFEATFSAGNVFEHNIAINSVYTGFWVTYSHDGTHVTNNDIENDAQNGIAADYSISTTIDHNTIVDNTNNGISIGSTGGITYVGAMTIHDNLIAYNGGPGITTNMVGNDTSTSPISNVAVAHNEIVGNAVGIHLAAPTANVVVHNNNILCNIPGCTLIEAPSVLKTVQASHNWWGSNDSNVISTGVTGPVTYSPTLQEPASGRPNIHDERGQLSNHAEHYA